MAECDSCESETVNLGYIFRSQAKYGTTAHTVHRDDVYVKHKVKPEETLQGISLSYGVTVSLTAAVSAVPVSQWQSRDCCSGQCQWHWQCSALSSPNNNNNMAGMAVFLNVAGYIYVIEVV